MTKNLKAKARMKLKCFWICQQWQHKQTREIISIMNTSEFHDDEYNFNVNYLNESGQRCNISADELEIKYTHIETMKGAYK